MPTYILSTTVSIPFRKISNKNIDKLIALDLKNKEKHCSSHGYIKEVSIIQRSQAAIKNINNESFAMFNVNYKIDTFNPQKGDIINCIISNNTKMGIIAYGEFENANYTLKDSPYLIIIPSNDDTANFTEGDKIDICVIASKLKYNSTQIQIIGKINK